MELFPVGCLLETHTGAETGVLYHTLFLDECWCKNGASTNKNLAFDYVGNQTVQCVNKMTHQPRLFSYQNEKKVE